MARSDTALLAALVKNVKKSGNDPLTPLIDRYLMEREKSQFRVREVTIPITNRARPGGRLSPSSICGCERQAAFKFLGVKAQKKINPDTELVFEDGNWRHHKWQAMFRDMEVVLGSDVFQVLGIEEAVVYEDLFIAGHLDARVLINQTLEAVIDFKGINDYGFGKITREQKADEKHVKQTLTYGKAIDVRDGFVMYDDKNDQRTKLFPVTYTRKQWAEIEQWCLRVISEIESKQLPPKHPDCKQGRFLYGKCPFAWLCFGGHDPEKVRRYAYKKFEGVEEAWERGHREVERHQLDPQDS